MLKMKTKNRLKKIFATIFLILVLTAGGLVGRVLAITIPNAPAVPTMPAVPAVPTLPAVPAAPTLPSVPDIPGADALGGLQDQAAGALGGLQDGAMDKLGDLQKKLSPDEYLAKLASAQEQLAAAKKKVEEAKAAVDAAKSKLAAAQSQLDQAKAVLARAQAAKAQAETELAQAEQVLNQAKAAAGAGSASVRSLYADISRTLLALTKEEAQAAYNTALADFNAKNAAFIQATTDVADAQKKKNDASDELVKASKALDKAKAEEVIAQETVNGLKFQVELETSFSRPPEGNTCPSGWKPESETLGSQPALLCTNGDSPIAWRYYIISEEWVQIIQGQEGGDILAAYAGMVYKWLAGVVGTVAVLLIIVGGIQISTAGASQGQLESGKNRIITALLGLMLLFLSGLILYTLNPTFFGG